MKNIVIRYKQNTIRLLVPVKILFAVLTFAGMQACNTNIGEEKESDPDVEYFSMRNASFGEIPAGLKEDIENRLTKDNLQIPGRGLTWKLIGPSNNGGRIIDIEMQRGDPNIIYAAASSGGIYK